METDVLELVRAATGKLELHPEPHSLSALIDAVVEDLRLIAMQKRIHIAQDLEIVLYVSGEESAQQMKMRGERLGAESPGLYILAETARAVVLAAVFAVFRQHVLVITQVQQGP